MNPGWTKAEVFFHGVCTFFHVPTWVQLRLQVLVLWLPRTVQRHAIRDYVNWSNFPIGVNVSVNGCFSLCVSPAIECWLASVYPDPASANTAEIGSSPPVIFSGGQSDRRWMDESTCIIHLWKLCGFTLPWTLLNLCWIFPHCSH